jgi:hypothetical protein
MKKTELKASIPPVYFNHLYVVLDDKTYRAIQSSDFLRIAFPGVERRATLTAAGETWYGSYFYCKDNYLEFFGESNGPVTGVAARSGHWQVGAQEGWAGMAFSTDRPGGVAAVREAIRQRFDFDPFTELRQMQTTEKTINWFYHVRLAERLGLGSFESWVMEYHPEVFAHKNIPLPANGELTRLAYLSSWNEDRRTEGEAEAAKESRPEQSVPKKESGISRPPGSIHPPVFSRVTGATIHLDAARAARFAEILELLGYARTRSGDQITLSAHGFSLEIQPDECAPEGYRLSKLCLEMARPSVAPMTFVFAPRSKLVLREDLTAEWIFGI